jgi:metal-sulfur cluster biosynthetic enzyme
MKKSLDEIRKTENEIYELLKQVIDPEIGIDIINLGLVYNIVCDGEKHVYIEMTLSTPACPLSDALVSAVENIIKKHFPDFDVDVELVFDPPWDTSMISEEGKKRLGMM